MKLRFRPAAAVLVLSLICIACGGGGGGGRTPTEPPSVPAGKRLQVTVHAAPGNFEGGILEGALLFDGREVGRVDWGRTGGPCSFSCGITADVQGISPGDHNVQFTVVRQQNFSMLYQFILSGTIIDPATGSRTPVTASSPRVQVRAGNGFAFVVRV